jgi:hypothetical protein
MCKDNQVSGLQVLTESDYQPDPIGSSGPRKLTANFTEPDPTHYKVKQFSNGEAVFIAYKQGNPDNLTPGRSEKEGLTDKARSKIRRSARFMQAKFGKCPFATLTYGQNIPTHKEAKKHLDNFFKRIRRRNPKVEYLWIAETQKRGAIHFHILLSEYIDKTIINDCWNSVVNNWIKKQGAKCERLYPNIQQVKKPSNYMAKYLTKEGEGLDGNFYNMSKGIRQLIKPVREYETTVRGPEYEVIRDCKKELKKAGIDYLEISNSDNDELTNFSYYADQLDEGEKFTFGFFIPPPEVEIDLVSLLIQAIYPSSKIHEAA